jgi:NADPH2:quinone reductase
MSTVIRFHQYGPPSVLQAEQTEVGAPGPLQVRLKQQAVGVNFIDSMFREGIFPMQLPGVTGVEGVGIIDAVGTEVQGLKKGDRAAYFLSPGAYAAVRLINATDLVTMPADVPASHVAAILTKGLTAWAGLNGFHRLQPGETILVQGASGNVGMLLSRWAKSLGAVVIGTAGSEEKRVALAADLDHAFRSDDPDLVAAIHQIKPRGVDVVYEFVGKATFESTVASVREGGTIVTIGAASGQPSIDQAALAARGIRVVGGPMANQLGGRPQEAVDQVFDAYQSGVFGDVVVTTYPLEDARIAHQDMATRRRAGPLVLIP